MTEKVVEGDFKYERMKGDEQPKLLSNVAGSWPKQWGADAFEAPTKYMASSQDSRQAHLPVAERDVCSKLLIIEKVCDNSNGNS
jgi:hypothetical protein